MKIKKRRFEVLGIFILLWICPDLGAREIQKVEEVGGRVTCRIFPDFGTWKNLQGVNKLGEIFEPMLTLVLAQIQEGEKKEEEWR